MAVTQDTSFQCPQCGHECSAKVWGSINVKEKPELKGQILDGSFFVNTCPECGNEVTLVYNCLYLDEDNHQMFYLIAGNGSEEDDFQAEQEAKAAANMVPFWREGDYILRIVHSASDLREKVMIFDAGYDDRVVEIAKGMALSQCPEGSYITEIHFASIAGQKVLVLIDNEGGEQYVTEFNELYNEMYSAYISALPPLYDVEFYTVDLNFAGTFLRSFYEDLERHLSEDENKEEQ